MSVVSVQGPPRGYWKVVHVVVLAAGGLPQDSTCPILWLSDAFVLDLVDGDEVGKEQEMAVAFEYLKEDPKGKKG